MTNIRLVNADTHQYDVQIGQVINVEDGIYTIIMPINYDQYKNLSQDKRIKLTGFDYKDYQVLSYGDPFVNDGNDGDITLHINRLLRDKLYYIPIDYNFETRKFKCYSDSSGYTIKWTEVPKYTFYKYCVSLIGNPKYAIIIKVYAIDFRNSEYYKLIHKE